MNEELNLNWVEPGPVAGAFVKAKGALVFMIQGPIGGGKTSAAFVKAIQLARQQRPSTLDGKRKFKLCVVHQTYRQLWRATIPSWWEWMPQSAGTWTGSKDGPAKHEIEIVIGDDTIQLTLEFIAIGDQDAEDVLRGYQPTAFYLNEADLLQKDVYTYSRGRAGRFPRMAEGGPSWYGLIMDFNAPVVDTWLYELIQELPSDHRYFRQPGARDPGAENLQNLPEGYYENQMSGQDRMYIRRMIDNQFGYSRDGRPVYGDDFNDDLHVAKTELQPTNGLPLIVGGDAGRTPAVIILQQMPNGQWRALEEVVGVNMGARKFGAWLNRVMAARYPGFVWTGYADPAASFAGDQDELSWLQIIANETKVRWRPAPLPNNNLTVRLGVVERLLATNIDGQPGLIVSPKCKILRRGFNSGYQYKRIQVSGAEQYHETPAKNKYSHPHDALQYGLLGGGEYSEVMGRERARNSGLRQVQAIDDDHPQGIFENVGVGRQMFAISDD